MQLKHKNSATAGGREVHVYYFFLHQIKEFCRLAHKLTADT